MTTAADKEKLIQSLSERRELKDAAKALLADPAFSHAFFILRERWYGAILAQPHDGPKQAEAVARLRGLEEMLDELARLIEDKRGQTRAA